MSSTGLEMHQNRFWSGLCPRHHWGSSAYSAPAYTLAGGQWEGVNCPPAQEHHMPWPFRLRPYEPRCLVPQTKPKINPSYDLDWEAHCYYASAYNKVETNQPLQGLFISSMCYLA